MTDAVRNEVLARLSALNGERAAADRCMGEALAKVAGAGEKPKRSAWKMRMEGRGLFGGADGRTTNRVT